VQLASRCPVTEGGGDEAGEITVPGPGDHPGGQHNPLGLPFQAVPGPDRAGRAPGHAGPARATRAPMYWLVVSAGLIAGVLADHKCGERLGLDLVQDQQQPGHRPHLILDSVTLPRWRGVI